MKLLVTGSSGFIGSALKNYLEKKGIEIIPFDIKEDPNQDICNFGKLNQKVSEIDGIIHLAAVSRVKLAFEDPINCIHTNVGGTVNILESVKLKGINKTQHPWVIFGSSREVYGEALSLPVTEINIKKPINIYGVSKLSGENLCRIYSTNYNVKTRILRFSNVYTGLNDHLDRVIPKFIFKAFNNEDLVINGSGEEIFDFTYISDVIHGIWSCIQEIERNQHLLDDFNLSSGIPISLKNLSEIIIKKTNSASHIKYVKSRSYDVNKFYADPQKANKILKFLPKVQLEEGIKLAISEFRNLI